MLVSNSHAAAPPERCTMISVAPCLQQGMASPRLSSSCSTCHAVTSPLSCLQKGARTPAGQRLCWPAPAWSAGALWTPCRHRPQRRHGASQRQLSSSVWQPSRLLQHLMLSRVGEAVKLPLPLSQGTDWVPQACIVCNGVGGFGVMCGSFRRSTGWVWLSRCRYLCPRAVTGCRVLGQCAMVWAALK